jgi:hypothetical protein
MDGWARLVIAAGEATTFDELRAAGEVLSDNYTSPSTTMTPPHPE